MAETKAAKKARLAKEREELAAKKKEELAASKEAENEDTATEEDKEVESKKATEPTVEPEPSKEDSEDTKKVEQEKVVKNVSDIDSIDDLDEFLVNNSNCKHSVDLIKNYLEVAGRRGIDDASLIAARYNFYLGLIKLINNENYNNFKANYTLLNRVFKIESGHRFNPINLVTKDYLWSFGTDSKLGYNILTKMLAMLSNPKTRAAKLKQVTVQNVFKYVNDAGTRNLTRFYNL